MKTLTLSLLIIFAVSCGGEKKASKHESHEGHDHSSVETTEKLIAENKTCPVSGDAVDGNSKVITVNGKNVKICCNDCEADLRKDPAKFGL